MAASSAGAWGGSEQTSGRSWTCSNAAARMLSGGFICIPYKKTAPYVLAHFKVGGSHSVYEWQVHPLSASAAVIIGAVRTRVIPAWPKFCYATDHAACGLSYGLDTDIAASLMRPSRGVEDKRRILMCFDKLTKIYATTISLLCPKQYCDSTPIKYLLMLQPKTPLSHTQILINGFRQIKITINTPVHQRDAQKQIQRTKSKHLLVLSNIFTHFLQMRAKPINCNST